ncbi:zinc finger MYND domain-containing protein 11 [Rhynchophorus ferrugineus]|uniref:Zinc finger MYND domain-containing protein 11 n=1 Tax=Rhynchophorus ferrugineus TaxID=354439 RepID=A0A834HXN7_RHYFE|nr:hypothetical protein GWI33_016946 [Rhynchophorus ferrugineus]
MPIRRHCNPVNIKRIWDAIRSATVSHQSSDINRILKYVQKFEICTQSQMEEYIQQALKDNLIVSRKNSIEPNSPTYKITDQELPQLDGKDWYCFECHMAGDVIPCKNCFRVYHIDCIKIGRNKFENQKRSYQKQLVISHNTSEHIGETEESEIHIHTTTEKYNDAVTNNTYDEGLCSICNIINIDECDLDKSEMNYLLKFVLQRIRAWLPNTITHTMAEEDRPSWLTETELTWRSHQLFFEHKDMALIGVNLNTDSYNVLSEFLADIYTIQHNVAIFHGLESQEYEASEYVVRDTLHDINELKNCSDCYKHSNEKINERWFALPCRNPHMLVWAKQKGYSYWPAKVIRETPSHCDVRFFGGKHERADIQKCYVKPITVTKEELKIKISLAFTKAFDELKYHQKLLTDPQELERVKAYIKAKKIIKPDMTFAVKPTEIVENVELVNSKVGSSTQKKKRYINDTPSDLMDTKKPKTDSEQSHHDISGNVIDISDGDEETSYSFRRDIQQENISMDDSEQVSSSTESCKNTNQEGEMQRLDQPYSDSVEKMRRKLESLPNKDAIIRCAMNCMQEEIDKITNDHNDHLKRLFESHNAQISETKKKQWCYYCEQDAIYHCCWNTAYCSQTCQQQHWQAEHKKVCRRKRQN